MDTQQAQKMIRATFEQPFEKTRFTAFLRNLCHRIADAPFTYQGQFIPDAYKPYISMLERIGKFNAGDHQIDLLVIKLKKETSLERARTMQRNFVAWYLNGSRGGELKDAALAAFIAPDDADWRFSLVKLDYKFAQTASGQMKVQEEFAPARRWSFLVGQNENSHTAQSRFLPMLRDDEHPPTLADLEDAFSIETVTNEFFREYRRLFLRVKEALDEVVPRDARIQADFAAKGVNTVDFAKKLLGQIVFLYFLQKKGWFGAHRDAAWGDGSKQFLRELFEKKHGSYHNFFNDILEPLFYEALRIDRSHADDYYSQFNCKIPFLNGGLFDPIGNYDWVHADLLLPDSLFSNTQTTKEGDRGDGILDIFDRYNFTVKEDEPLEKEVAIDPELLGKAYEKFNAIRPDNFAAYKAALQSGRKGDESQFNKQFGVYYTPREIVHYMCQQSLINYLTQECQNEALAALAAKAPLSHSISTEDIEKLIRLGEQVSANEAQVLREGRETKTYAHQLPASIRHNAGLLDQKLADITVCDPAVGSGAFPVGMMSEIVKARTVLSTFFQQPDRTGLENLSGLSIRTAYDFKRHCIEHSLYGVDIDPGAVEIAKLRLWLSLVVDEDDPHNIKPLPNLDYKIVCGNSLMGVEQNLFNHQLFTELEQLKPRYFNETNPTHKQQHKKQIDGLISRITNGHQEFDFEVYFSEVFHAKGGFNVVIGNPPYIQSHSIANAHKTYLYNHYQTAEYQLNTFGVFIEKSIKLLKKHGVYSLIIPNYWLSTKYDEKLRQFVFLTNQTHEILNIFNVFESASVDTIVIIGRRTQSCQFPKTLWVKSVSSKSKCIEERLTAIAARNWAIQREVVFSDKNSDTKISFEEKFELQGRYQLSDFVELKQGMKPYQVGKGNPPQTQEILEQKIFDATSKIDNSYLPLLRARGIKRYLIVWENDWIKYGQHLAEPRTIELFQGERILIRRIISGEHIEGTFLSETYINNTDLINIFPKHGLPAMPLKVLTAILLSKLCAFVLKKENVNLNRATFPKINVETLKTFPIPDIPESQQDLLVVHVDKMLELRQQLHAETQKFLRFLEVSYHPKTLSNKLEAFDTLAFSEFIKELARQKVVLSKKDELVLLDVFEEQKTMRLSLKYSLQTTDQELDQLIYHLYGLTAEEISLVEGKI